MVHQASKWLYVYRDDNNQEDREDRWSCGAREAVLPIRQGSTANPKPSAMSSLVRITLMYVFIFSVPFFSVCWELQIVEGPLFGGGEDGVVAQFPCSFAGCYRFTHHYI